ncbi:WG repeat-containing protein [Adhaeribacter soli]|uniref:WG repeat-containing protein n=1 Tax=Adhaeribacter soli TaxID=2607655 RepID=A0A5N1IRP7_9BACT|nr:WG repeat-containing protein [Adhaeribacter soli]KAA9332667.1 WG repeat-containing protein [Adhaeribacter soli]
MLVLKNSPLGYGLIKAINPKTGLYGAVSEFSNSPVIDFEYELICPFKGERAIVKKNGKYFEIDMDGVEYFGRTDFGLEPFFIKSDSCPDCYNILLKTSSGCLTCFGWGCIPPNYNFDCD